MKVQKIVAMALAVMPLLTLCASYEEDVLVQGMGYRSRFVPPSETAKTTLIKGQILGPNEYPHEMIERVANTIALAEALYMSPKHIMSTHDFINQLGNLMDEGAIVFSTPIMTNAGRFNERPLSACAMPPIDLRVDMTKIKQMVDQYHQDGMGTGYNLSDIDNPIKMLTYLNDIAVQGANSKKEQRPVGNMAILDVDSPAIEEFVMLKVGADDRGEDWKFNLSVNITDAFMDAVEKNEGYILKDGKIIQACALFEKMAFAAHTCGDPGFISSARLNQDNPTPLVGEYKCTAPCAEVGLAPGETCVFGYINLAKLVNDQAKGQLSIDFDRLKPIVYLLTRALDNILEISIQRYLVPQSKIIMQAKRKIGIGICGFADMLIALGISYSDESARDLIQDIMNFISYHSKQASFELALDRGSFKAIETSRYMDESFIMNKYGLINTPHVSAEQWKELAQKIKQTKCLRNATTTALPPTGRSANVIAASTGIEPLFSFSPLYPSDSIHAGLLKYLKEHKLDQDEVILDGIRRTGRCPKGMGLPEHVFITATEISPEDHLAMVIAAQKAIDESISKTINLPEDITVEQIISIYKQAYAAGVKGITVYRNNSRFIQPKKLSQSENK